jgi:membrane protein DedA with SNARE-associated domain
MTISVWGFFFWIWLASAAGAAIGFMFGAIIRVASDDDGQFDEAHLHRTRAALAAQGIPTLDCGRPHEAA